MIKIIRGWRVLRVGRGRVIRVLMVVLLLILAWQTLLSKSPNKDLSNSPSDVEGKTKGLDMQVQAPANEVKSSVASILGEAHKAEIHWKTREDVLRGSDNINPRYAAKFVKEDIEEPRHNPVRNQNFVQQSALEVIEDVQGEGEDDDDEYEEYKEGDENHEGKWNGRNKDDNADNNAVEEQDEVANDNFDLEDVGGEKLEKNEDEDEEEPKPKRKKEQKELEGDEEGAVEFGELIGDRKKDEDENKEEVKSSFGKDKQLDMDAVEKDMAQRKARIEKVCAKHGIGPHARAGGKPVVRHPPTPNYDVFYIDKREELAWCPVYKAASTSWLYNFIKLGGVEESEITTAKEQVSTIARRIWPPLPYEDAEQAFETCLKFMIVRHPFERLVSAYRDKLENLNIGQEHGVGHFYKKYGRKIVEKYRPAGQGLPAVRYSQDMDDPSLPAPKGVEPTFEEFVKYLIGTDLVYYADDHWMPYYLYCTPCLLDYDVIAKFETLERDQNYVILKKHLGNKIKPTWKHLTKGVKTSDTVRKYFATITKKDLMELYKKYQLDFELFDYSVDEYLEYVRDSS
ncbi:carbohydrate sulfotransferase 13-like [Palaemon carinicauda]|uniref:carbohydrate sulfotransferase 13-like n=1 Tax=Palaemon carinicauda TaxID=392227 RepID=UPI0035B67AB7